MRETLLSHKISIDYSCTGHIQGEWPRVGITPACSKPERRSVRESGGNLGNTERSLRGSFAC
jgi:hypothetical protein